MGRRRGQKFGRNWKVLLQLGDIVPSLSCARHLAQRPRLTYVSLWSLPDKRGEGCYHLPAEGRVGEELVQAPAASVAPPGPAPGGHVPSLQGLGWKGASCALGLSSSILGIWLFRAWPEEGQRCPK